MHPAPLDGSGMLMRSKGCDGGEKRSDENHRKTERSLQPRPFLTGEKSKTKDPRRRKRKRTWRRNADRHFQEEKCPKKSGMEDHQGRIQKTGVHIKRCRPGKRKGKVRPSSMAKKQTKTGSKGPRKGSRNSYLG